jgi:DNA topoisomerase-2
MTRESLANLTEEKAIKMFKLEETETEIFTTLDEHGKLKIFESDIDIVNYFTNFRLGFYSLRKEKMLSDLVKEQKDLSNKGNFIRYILSGKLEVKNIPKKDIIDNMEQLGLDKKDESYDYLLRMPIWSLTQELYEKLKKDYSDLKKEIDDLEKQQPKDMYLNDLKELRKKIQQNA